MKKEGQELPLYTIEREFLGKITAAELLSRIIQAHMEHLAESGEEPS